MSLDKGANTSMDVYGDLPHAFYGINYGLLLSSDNKAIVHRYNYQFYVAPNMGKGFNFTKLANYTDHKWGGLVSNYLDYSKFGVFANRVSERLGSRDWAETFKFSHNTLTREACLISVTAMNDGEHNELFVHVRTSEIYKRLAMDLVLFKRLGDHIFIDNPYTIHVYINHLWLSSDWASMLLIKTKVRRRCKDASVGTIANRSYEKYIKFKHTPWKELSYNSHKRPCRVIQRDTHANELLSGDCLI